MTTYEIIRDYCEYQLLILKKSLEYDAAKLRDRLEIIGGLLKAIEDIDNIIALIKSSPSAAQAKINLQSKYELSEKQASAILDMKLSRLANMEKIELQKEATDKQNDLSTIEIILSSEQNLKTTLKKKLQVFADTFGDARKTQLMQINETKEEKEIVSITPEDVVVKVTEDGLISRIPVKKFQPQKRGGIGYKNKGEIINKVINTNTLDILMIFTSLSKVYRISVNDIPEEKAVALSSLVQFEPQEKYVTIASTTRDSENQYVWFFTKNGTVKRTALKEYFGVKRKSGTIATKLREGDELIRVFVSPITDADIMIFTRNGLAIRCPINQFPLSSKASIGLKGISLNENDYVVNAGIVQNDISLAVFTEDGQGKLLDYKEFPRQNRAGKGIKCTPNGLLADAIGLTKTENILIIGTMSNICIKQNDLDISSRQSVGKKVIKSGKILQVIAV